MDDFFRLERLRGADLASAALGTDDAPPLLVARTLVQVYDGGALPTAPDRVYLTRPVSIDVDESEGATPGFVVGDASIPVVVIGSQTPKAGDYLIARAIGGRWVADKGAGVKSKATFKVYGCSALLLAGAVVKIWSNSSRTTLLGTAASDCNGSALVAGNFPSTFFYEVSHPSGRLTPVSSSGSYPGVYTVTLSTPTAGYHCAAWHPLPLPETLHYRDDFNGPITLGWDGSKWTGSTTTSFPGGKDQLGNTCDGAPDLVVTLDVMPNVLTAAAQLKYPQRVSPRCAGGSTVATHSGAVASACASGVYSIAISWFPWIVNPTSTSSYSPTLTE